MLLARAVRLPSLLLVFCQVKQERSYAYSTTLVSQSVSQSVRRRLTILRFSEIFVFMLPSLSSVFEARYCRYGFSVTRRLVWSTLNGWFGCIFDVGRVNIFFVRRVLHSAPGPFLLLSMIV